MWRVRSSNEIKWKCWMFFLKEGENLMIVEVWLKNRTLWGYRRTYPYSQRKGVPPPRVSAQPRAIEFLWQKFSAIFSATISLRKFPSYPQTKIWLLWQFPFPLCYDDIYDDIYDDTSAKPCTCSKAINKLAVTILKYWGKRQVNTRVKGISHIWKRSWWHVRLAW